MNNLKFVVFTLVFSVSFSLMGCSSNSPTSGTQAVFANQSEAEKAAKDFNCTGAHRMGKSWMPCKNHDSYKEIERYETRSKTHSHQ